jgi:hypothetical protein
MLEAVLIQCNQTFVENLMKPVKHAAPALRIVPQDLDRQRGASLLEGIAYLGIAAIVILGAVSLLTGAFSSAQSNRTSEEVTAIRTSVRKLYMGQGYGTGSLNEALIAAKAVPGTIVQGAGSTLTTGWGGSVTVEGSTTSFEITYTATPKDICMNTLTTANGWTGVKVGDLDHTTFPVAAADAITACASDTNVMVFTSI